MPKGDRERRIDPSEVPFNRPLLEAYPRATAPATASLTPYEGFRQSTNVEDRRRQAPELDDILEVLFGPDAPGSEKLLNKLPTWQLGAPNPILQTKPEHFIPEYQAPAGSANEMQRALGYLDIIRPDLGSALTKPVRKRRRGES